ncbi:hypothetical protein [Gordonia sp. (in: high G+C Gram-positive bacteria)]|uniref:hypothetical protein n=1 Tax=Gordonia sp. (in: high G+C Gram-positive bacteria) TaxID=84139 RepID=UPI00333EB6AE
MIWIILGVLVLLVVDCWAWWFVTMPAHDGWEESDSFAYLMFLILWIAAHFAGLIVGGIMLIRYGVGQLA